MVTSPRASFRGRDPAPVDWYDDIEHRRKHSDSINSLRVGKIDSVSTVTLTANQTTTTLTDIYIGPDSQIGFTPLTANAAAEIGNGTMYVSARTNGSATITHANNAQTDRDFSYSVLG